MKRFFINGYVERNNSKLKNKAFTLIELLAIIVILAIIAVITVPIILNIIENSRMGAATDSAYGYKDAVNKHYISKLFDNSNLELDGEYTVVDGVINGSGIDHEEIPVSGKKPTSGILTYENNVLKNGCLVIDDYAVTFVNENVVNTIKGVCDGIVIDDVEYAAQTILNKGYYVEIIDQNDSNYSNDNNLARLSANEKKLITDPVRIEHPAVTENTATGSIIPALTSYRYMGANPNNWIYFNCEDYSEDKQSNSTCELWRIISIENGKLKIITDSPIGSSKWYKGYNHYYTNITHVNDWAASDLNEFLNAKYLDGSIVIDSDFDSFSFSSDGTTGKFHTFLNSSTSVLIDNSTWFLGGGDFFNSTASQIYAMERNNVKYTGDNITRVTSVNSKVALISSSDYGFASSICHVDSTLNGGKNLSNYNDESCTSSNWMFTSLPSWFLNPFPYQSDYALALGSDGSLTCGQYGYDCNVVMANNIRPSLYLKSDIKISGTGTNSNPYKIILDN